MYVAACVEQRSNDVNVSVGRSPVQRVRVVSCLTRIRIRVVFQQQSDHVGVPAFRCFMESRPTTVELSCVGGAWERRIVREQAAQDFDVAFCAGVEKERNMLRVPPLGLPLQGTPARESVVARH